MNILEFFGVNEYYKLPEAIMKALMSDDSLKMLADLKNEFTEEFDICKLVEETQTDRKKLKQDYTPAGICKLVAGLCLTGKTADLCSGVGNLAQEVAKASGEVNEFEFSEMNMPYALLNACLAGYSGYISRADVLMDEVFETFKLEMRTGGLSIPVKSEIIDCEFDNVIMNPPYSMSISDDLLVNGLTVPKSKMDYGFVLKGLEKLSANGRLIAVLPHGVLFRGGKEETIRKWLIDNNLIKAVIGLPPNMFFNTQIPVFILVLERKNDNILFVDASKDFVKDGKFNRLESSHIEKILSVVKNNLEVKYYSHVATKAELQKNDYNLNVPRYIDLPPADPIDGVAVLNELIEIHQQQMDTAKDLSAMIKQLVPSTEENKMVINLTLKALDIEQR